MPTFPETFAAILRAACMHVFTRTLARARAPRPMLLLILNYIERTITRVARLHARWQAGTLPPPRHDFPRPPRAAAAPQTPPAELMPAEPMPAGSPPAGATPAAPRLRLPRTRAWLRRQDPALGPFGTQLHHLLSQPDFAAFLRAAPQAARLVRPILRLLSAEPPPPRLALPRRPRRPRPPRPRAPAPPPLRPTPRYVLLAARAWRRTGG